MNRMRLKIASRLKEAQNTNAMLTTFNELDMSAIMQLRKDNQDAFVKKHGIKMGFMSAFVKASAYALTKQPTVNAVIEGQETIYRDYVDISVAVATPKVLTLLRLWLCSVPVLFCEFQLWSHSMTHEKALQTPLFPQKKAKPFKGLATQNKNKKALLFTNVPNNINSVLLFQQESKTFLSWQSFSAGSEPLHRVDDLVVFLHV